MSQFPPPMPLNYGGPDTAPPKPVGRIIGWVFFIGLAAVFFFILQQKNITHQPTIPLSEFRQQLVQNNVKSLTINENAVHGVLVRPITLGSMGAVTTFETRLPTGMGTNWGFVDWVLTSSGGAVVITESEGNLVEALVIPLIPWVLVFGFIWFFVFRQLRARSGAQAPPTRVLLVNPEALK